MPYFTGFVLINPDPIQLVAMQTCPILLLQTYSYHTSYAFSLTCTVL